jgi:hypothetical protein
MKAKSKQRRPKVSRARLAEGEATGHFHEAIGLGVALLGSPRSEYLTAPFGAEVHHQEHHTVTLPAGDYERTIVREYDHFGEESRRVVD